MRAAVIYADNPFAPAARRYAEVRGRLPISRLAPRGSRPVIALLNGRAVLRQDRGWQRTRLRDGDQLMFVTLPRGGGGGGGGGSDPLRIILTIAIMAAAGPLAGAILGTTAGAAALAGGLTAFTFSATQAAVAFAGMALVNALLPTPKGAQQQSPSPTYTLTAQGNAARIEAPIPVQYGRVLSYPDFAAQPYWEYAGEEQYLYQLLCLGVGEFDIEEIRIEDTPISAFAEIETEIVPPGGDVTLFPTSVITSVEVSGQSFPGLINATWARVGTTVTVTLAAHGFAVGQVKYLNFTSGGATSDAYVIASVPTVDTFTVTVPAVGISGACMIYGVLGGIDGFVASPAATVAHKIGIDLVCPAGLYFRQGSGRLTDGGVNYVIQARLVDDLGAPLAGWITLESGSLVNRTVTPVRTSLRYDLATPGRYRIRAWRTSTASDTDETLWAGLRSYMAEPQDRGPVTLVAMRMQATNNLSLQASRKIAILATRKVPVWNGTSWSAATATSSPAWALADAARDSVYGAGLADSRIDLASLLALDAVWAARGDSFNGRFDSAQSWWEAVRKIAAVGRAKPFMQGGVLRVVRDAAVTVPVALYSMRNIKKDSFSIDYLMPSEATADAVTATYFDATTWAPQRVTATLPGSSAAKPAKVEKFGITDRDQALREATYDAAVNRYRRRIVKFDTEMEGFIPGFGDLIAIQHDMAGWGAHAEALGWNAATRALTLSEPMTVTGASVVGLRRADGSLSGPWAVTAGASSYEVILTSTPDMTPEVAGQTRERTHVVFGTVNTWSTFAKVIRAQPRGIYEVSIEAVVDDPSVHTADTGLTLPPRRTSDLPRRVTKPIVSGLFASKIPGDAIRCVFGWRPAAGAETYHVEMAEGTDVDSTTAKWTRVADTSAATQAQFLLHSLQTMIRVRGVGLTAGPWAAATLGSLIPNLWNTDDTSMWTVDANPMWSA